MYICVDILYIEPDTQRGAALTESRPWEGVRRSGSCAGLGEGRQAGRLDRLLQGQRTFLPPTTFSYNFITQGSYYVHIKG